MDADNRSTGFRKTVTVIMCVIVVVLIARVVYSRHGPIGATSNGSRSWYTIDDGATRFAGDANLIPPFQKDGKTAYGCAVWETADGKTSWVVNLIRYKPAPPSNGGPAQPLETRLEVKLPRTGDQGWVGATSGRGIEIQTPVGPSPNTAIRPLLP